MGNDENKSELEAIKEENDLLKSILDNIHEGVEVSDEEGRMIFFNAACEKIEGLRRKDILGRKITDIYNVTEETSTQRKVYKTGNPIIEEHHQYSIENGKDVNVIASTYPYYDDGEIKAVYSINRDVTKIKELMNKSFELQRCLESNNESSCKNGTYYTFDKVIGESRVLKDVIAAAKKTAQNNSSVLIFGETGTGKEMFAQSIHNASSFTGAFIPVNCAAIPDNLLESVLFGTKKGAFTGAVDSIGLFEKAKGGTLFLDEINSMKPKLQAKLLRVLEEKAIRRVGENTSRRINCRIISAVNKDPIESVKNGELREDLYYRLAGVTLYIPTLKERQVDIPLLTDYFIKKYNQQFGTAVKSISNELLKSFKEYSWPGNVRELEHAIESTMNMVSTEERSLEVEHLPRYLQDKLIKKDCYQIDVKKSGKLQEMVNEFERKLLIKELKKNGGNISQTADELGIYRQALQYRIKKYDIDIERLRSM